MNYDRPLDAAELATLHAGVERRGRGEPLQYVTGEMPFRHIVLKCAPGVLIPRPETEVLVDCVLDYLDALVLGEGDTASVLEVGTGTGCIALSLAGERPFVRVSATDVSPDAVALAGRNRDALGLDGPVELFLTDLADGVPGAEDAGVRRARFEPSLHPLRPRRGASRRSRRVRAAPCARWGPRRPRRLPPHRRSCGHCLEAGRAARVRTARGMPRAGLRRGGVGRSAAKRAHCQRLGGKKPHPARGTSLTGPTPVRRGRPSDEDARAAHDGRNDGTDRRVGRLRPAWRRGAGNGGGSCGWGRRRVSDRHGVRHRAVGPAEPGRPATRLRDQAPRPCKDGCVACRFG